MEGAKEFLFGPVIQGNDDDGGETQHPQPSHVVSDERRRELGMC